MSQSKYKPLPSLKALIAESKAEGDQELSDHQPEKSQHKAELIRNHLTLVPTPIGNLDDITLRSIKVLQAADCILAEDTRTAGILLKHLGIKRPLESYHIFNEHQTIKRLLDRMERGEQFVLVSDAGTPGISDPGFLLVRETLAAGFTVDCLPGATAFVPALVRSGLPTDSFVFEGFLPVKKGRQTKLQAIAQEERTVVLYESPHRLIKTLEQLIEVLGPDRRCSVSRELTKLFEETVNGSLAEVLAHFNANGVKGELVIVVAGK